MFYIFSKIYKSLTLGLRSCLSLGLRLVDTDVSWKQNTCFIFFPKYINLSHLDFTAVPDLDVSCKQNTCFIFFSQIYKSLTLGLYSCLRRRRQGRSPRKSSEGVVYIFFPKCITQGGK